MLEELHQVKKELTKEINSIKKALSFPREAPNFECYDIGGVAKILGCSKESVRNYVRQGLLRVRYPNAKKAFHPQDVEYYMRGRVARK